jgi:signal transduction histidine kinase
MVNETLQQTRTYAHDSFPVELKEIGLDSILRSLCERTAKQTDKPCDYNSDQAVRDCAFNSDQGINIFRIAQEAIQNAVKHAKASRIDVSLKAASGQVVLLVEDDGKTGFQPPTDSPSDFGSLRGMGLRSMNYRASQIGGILSLAARLEGGTRVSLSLPTPARI